MAAMLNVTNGANKLMVDLGHFQRGFLYCFMEETSDDERGHDEGFALADSSDPAENERGHSGHSRDDQRGITDNDSPKSRRRRRAKSRGTSRTAPE